MPIALRRDAIHRVVLSSDRSLPESDQAVFLVRVMTGHDEACVIESLRDAAGTDSAKQIDVARELLEQVVIGWENLSDIDGQQIPSLSRRFDQILTSGEMWELFQLAFEANRITATERGNFDSPSSLRASAGDAQAGGASTLPQSTSLRTLNAQNAKDWDAMHVTILDTDGSKNAQESISAESHIE